MGPFTSRRRTDSDVRSASQMKENAGLEVKPGSELECAGTARSKNAVRTLCWPQCRDLIRRRSLDRQNEIAHVYQIRDIEQIESLADQL